MFVLLSSPTHAHHHELSSRLSSWQGKKTTEPGPRLVSRYHGVWQSKSQLTHDSQHISKVVSGFALP